MTLKKHILPLIAAVLALASCGRYEEFYFKATVVSGEICSSNQVGYLLEVEKPAGMGDTATVGGTLHRNAVMAYRAPRILKKGETVYGVAYEYKDFAALNCVLLPLYKLPEWSLISVDENPSVIE